MDPYVVFLHKHRDLVARSSRRPIADEDHQYSALMAAPILREMLMGSPSLVTAANDSRVKIRYTFVPFRPQHPEPEGGDMKLIVGLSGDGFDPASSDPWSGSPETTPVDGLLRAPVGELEGSRVTVKDFVDYAANAAGGVHLGDPTKHNREVVAALNSFAEFNGYEPVLYQLMAIGRVVAAGVQPLVDLLRAK